MKTPDRLAVKLRPTGEKIIKRGHPWVFSDSINKLKPEGNTGDLVILFSEKENEVYAIGLYDADSPVRVKIIHHGGPTRIDAAFFKKKILQAFLKREPLFQTDTDAYRLIFGENDGFPGIIADIYDKVCVVKLYSAIWFPYVQMLARHLADISTADTVVLRLSRNLQRKETPLKEGDVLLGNLESPDVQFVEYGVKFTTNVLRGHKTGFFLDHRTNRHKISQLAAGKSFLDVFSYTGGFAVHALARGAHEVTSMDVSKQALELALENSKLNLPSGKYNLIEDDVFHGLQKLINQRNSYDIVVIDPPSFAKSEKEKTIALKKYAELTELGVKLTKAGGLLVLASCSSRVSAIEFKQVHKVVFKNLAVNYTVEDFTEHDIDHPVKFEEGAYLKTVYYRIHGA